MRRSQSCSIVIGGGKPIPFDNGAQSATKSPAVGKSASMSGFGALPDLRKLDINPITSVDEFCPEGGPLGGFLDDVQFHAAARVIEHEETDS